VLVIASEPSGATVMRDGAMVGVTPFRLDNPETTGPQRPSFVLTLPGYATAPLDLRVKDHLHSVKHPPTVVDFLEWPLMALGATVVFGCGCYLPQGRAEFERVYQAEPPARVCLTPLDPAAAPEAARRCEAHRHQNLTRELDPNRD
jgi:hypothetical protein